MEGSFSRSRSKKASIVKPFERWVSGSVDWGRGEVEENLTLAEQLLVEMWKEEDSSKKEQKSKVSSKV
jgi:hypothetical protein